MQVKAPQALWGEFPTEEVSAFADFSGLAEGDHDVPVQVTVRNPRIIVLEKDPEKLVVRLEAIAKLEKDLEREVAGSPAEGYVAKDPESDLSRVKIQGAASTVARVAHVVARVELQGTEKEEVRRLVTLVARDAAGAAVEGITLQPETVEVRVPVEQERRGKSVRVEVRTSGTVPDGYELRGTSAQPGSVEIEGIEEKLSGIETIQTAIVDVSGMRGAQDRTVNVELPDGVSLKEGQSVRVHIDVAERAAVKSVLIKVETEGLAKGLKVVSVSPSSVALTLAGGKPRLDILDLSTVRVLLSLTGREAGTYDLQVLPAQVHLPEGVQLRSVDTPRVRVELAKP